MKSVNLLVLAAVFIFPHTTVWANGKIEAVGGGKGVVVKRGNKTLSLQAGAQLNADDELTTAPNQAVDIRYDNRSLVRLGGNTQYRIGSDRKISPWHDQLMKGFLRVLVPERKKGAANGGKIKLHLTTPTGTIGVRGTEFTIKASAEETELRALHGAVLFGPREADFKDISRFVVVLRGYQSQVREGDKKPSLPKTFELEKYIRLLDGKSPANPTIGLSDRRTGAKVNKVAKESEGKQKNILAVKIKQDKKKPHEETKTVEEELAQLQKELLEAVRNDEVETVEDIMGKLGGEGVRLNTGDSILHVAAVYDSYLTIQFFIDRGVSVDVQNSKGDTPLMYVAGKSGVAETALLLLQNGADPTLENNDKKTAIDLAKAAGHDAIVELFEEEVKRHKED